ncbi:MAG TPA: peptidase MA family metallohydrolase [Anaerolineae bacterium]|nr:peptidase MA family metallohydrolase [Anaerolineae bacterium]HQH38180.1 peptidase MA family metallohydrolase [Anaerolineae bacterium]
MGLIRARHNRAAIKLLALAGPAFLLALAWSPLYAQANVTVAHTYTFGQSANFTLTLPSENAPDVATLYLKIGTYTQAYPTPVIQGQGEYQRDLREQPFPPFTYISYWWEYKDAQGNTHTTEKPRFLYEDNRFLWQTLQEDTITLHWVSGDTSLMLNALDIAQASITEIRTTLQAPSTGAVSLYIYPSLPDLQSALRLTGREWVGGQAYPEIGVVLLAISPSAEATVKMKRDIPHELAHKVLYDLAGPQGYSRLPIWLVEGVASSFERSPDPAYTLALQQAISEGKLMTLETLCYPFPEEYDRALLAYAQSQSFVQYLRQTYGWSQIQELIKAYADGKGYSAGAKQVLGSDLTTLERNWRVWMEQEKQSGNAVSATWSAVRIVVRDLAPWLVLIGLLFLPALIVWLSSCFGRPFTVQ